MRLTAGSVAALLAGSLPARADEPSSRSPVILDWRAPPGCPSSDEVEAAVRRHFPAGTADARPHVRVDVDRENDRLWEVTLTWQEAPSPRRRSFTAESCRAAADASALIVALTLKTAHPLEGEDDRTVTQSSPDPERRHALEAPREASLSTHPHVWAAGVSIVGNLGDLPAPRPGLGLSIRVAPERRWSAIHVRGAIAGFLPASTASGPAGGRFFLATASAELCVEPSVRWLQLGGCAIAQGALLAAHGAGQTESSTSRIGGWLLVGLRATSELPITPNWSLRAELGPALGVGRPTFQAAGPTRQGTFVFRPGPFAGDFSLGAEARF